MALGEYPVLTLLEARERHLEVRKMLNAGIDPMTDRKEKTRAKQEEFIAQQRETESSFQKVAY